MIRYDRTVSGNPRFTGQDQGYGKVLNRFDREGYETTACSEANARRAIGFAPPVPCDPENAFHFLHIRVTPFASQAPEAMPHDSATQRCMITPEDTVIKEYFPPILVYQTLFKGFMDALIEIILVDTTQLRKSVERPGDTRREFDSSNGMSSCRIRFLNIRVSVLVESSLQMALMTVR